MLAMRILIVDDNETMRSLLRRSLSQGGFDNLVVSEAANGREGLEQFHQTNPDVILSDWNMPEMDGLGLLKAIRQENQDVLFGIITAQNTSALRRSAKQLGAQFLLSKPFSTQKLNTTIHSFIA